MGGKEQVVTSSKASPTAILGQLVWWQSDNSESLSNPSCLSHKSLLSQKGSATEEVRNSLPSGNINGWGGNSRALGSAWLLVGTSTCGLRIASGRVLEEGFCSTWDNEQRDNDEFSSVEKSILNPPLIKFQLIQMSYWITVRCQVWVSNRSRIQIATEEGSSECVHLKTEPSHKPRRNPCCDDEDTAPTHTLDTDLITLLKAFNTDLTGRILKSPLLQFSSKACKGYFALTSSLQFMLLLGTFVSLGCPKSVLARKLNNISLTEKCVNKPKPLQLWAR